MSESTVSPTSWCRWWPVKGMMLLSWYKELYVQRGISIREQGSGHFCWGKEVLMFTFRIQCFMRYVFPAQKLLKCKATQCRIGKSQLSLLNFWYFTNNKSTSFILPNRVGFHWVIFQGRKVTCLHITYLTLTKDGQRDRQTWHAHARGQRIHGSSCNFPSNLTLPDRQLKKIFHCCWAKVSLFK